MDRSANGRTKVIWVILEQLKEKIATGELKKGDRLESERQLEQRLGFSRAAIREALKSLELMGIITCVQGDGNFIADDLGHSLEEPLAIMFMLEGGSLMQIQQLRQAMEFATVTLAAKSITEDQLDSLRVICKRLENPPHSSTENDRAALDREFHFIIMSVADNPLITSILNAARSLFEEHIKKVWRQVMRSGRNSEQVDIQHRNILRALEAHNPQEARNALSAHMEFIENAITACLD